MAQAVVTQADWTPLDDGGLQDLRLAAAHMITSVGKSGSSKPDNNVLAFQKLWNASKGLIVKALALAQGWTISKATPYFVALKEDGGYGSNTAGALNILITPGPKAPTTAAGMPTYLAKNAGFVASLAPISGGTNPGVINNPGSQKLPATNSATSTVSSSQTYVPSVATQASKNSGSSTTIVTTTIPGSDDNSLPPDLRTKPVPTNQSTTIDFTSDVPTTVVATKTGTDFKLVGVVIGGLALGGTLFWMARKKHG